MILQKFWDECRLSHHSVKEVEKNIFRSLRGANIKLPDDEKDGDRILKQASGLTDKPKGKRVLEMSVVLTV